MIKNSLLDAVMEINPRDDRLMSITLRGSVHTTLINCYMETAENSDRNHDRYKLLGEQLENTKNWGQHSVGET